MSRTGKKARKSGRREKNASRKRAVEPAAVTRAFRRTWRCVREITLLPFHPGADALALPAAAVQPRPAGEAREHVENVNAWGVRALARRNVGFRFASLALRPMETLELRAAFGVARAVGSRAACADVWSRASRGAYGLRAPRRCDETLSNVSSSLFALQKRPFLPARHVKGEGT